MDDVGDQEVLLDSSGTGIFAIAAQCSHYHGPLSEGLVCIEDSIHCPGITFVSICAATMCAPTLKFSWLLASRSNETAGVFIREKLEQPKLHQSSGESH